MAQIAAPPEPFVSPIIRWPCVAGEEADYLRALADQADVAVLGVRFGATRSELLVRCGW